MRMSGAFFFPLFYFLKLEHEGKRKNANEVISRLEVILRGPKSLPIERAKITFANEVMGSFVITVLRSTLNIFSFNL